MSVLRSLYAWFVIIMCFIIFMPFQFLLFLLTAPFDRRRRIMHYHASYMCMIGLGLSPIWKVRFEGKEHLDRSRSHVVIMNHQSLLDVLIAFRLFYPVKMIGKKILALVPIVGWNLYLSGHLLVDRTSTKSQFQAIRKMENLLTHGDSLLVFPEGTRTKDGEIGEYKKGAFRSASTTGTPLLPVVIDGPFQTLPKKGFICRGKHIITIRVLPPIPVEKGEKPGDLALKSHDIMVAELARIRKNLPPSQGV